jgi:hypothetical protein
MHEKISKQIKQYKGYISITQSWEYYIYHSDLFKK